MWSEFAVWLLLLGCSQTDFKQQLEHFNKDLFTLVAWDPRGYGKSIPPTRDWPEQFFRRDADDAAKLMEVCSSTFLNQITFATTNRLCISICVTNFLVYLGHPLAWGALWTLCIDYCNCLLAGVPRYQFKKLQAMMNSSGRLICGQNKFDHISRVLCDRLYWLPVEQRIQYKLCWSTRLAPEYLVDFCQPVSAISGRSELWSSMLLSRLKQISENALLPCLHHWHRLPEKIRSLQSLQLFKFSLKAHYASRCAANRWVFNVDLKLSMLSVGSLRESGNECQTIGAATENDRRPNLLRRCRGTTSWRRLADRTCWRLETSDVRTEQSTKYWGARFWRHR